MKIEMEMTDVRRLTIVTNVSELVTLITACTRDGRRTQAEYAMLEEFGNALMQAADGDLGKALHARLEDLSSRSGENGEDDA